MKAINETARSAYRPSISYEESRARASRARSEHLRDCIVTLAGLTRMAFDKAAGAVAFVSRSPINKS